MIVTLESLETIQNAILVDIREEYERETFSLESALAVPMGVLVEEVSQFSKSNNYVLFCQSGNRSTNLTKMLRIKGYTNIYSLEGGANLLSERKYK